MFANLLRRLTNRDSTSRRIRRRPTTYFQPQLEALEERAVMSTVQVSIDPAVKYVNEDGGKALFTVTRSGGVSGHSAKVDYTIGQAGDTATYFKDYRGSRSGSITFGKGETTKTIVVGVIDDKIDEKAESPLTDYEKFTVNLTGVRVSNGGVGMFGNKTAQGVIIDNDRPTVGVGQQDMQVSESKGRMDIVVGLSNESEETVTVKYSINSMPNEVKYGIDVAVVGGGQTGILTFKPGETRKTLTVQILDDKIVEADETFFVRVEALANADTGSSVCEAIIEDNDRPVFRIEGALRPSGEAEFEQNSGSFNVALRIVLETDTEVEQIVPFATFDGSAREADGDYQGQWGEYTFAAGSKAGAFKTINVKINGDRRIEADEYFYVKLRPYDGNSYRIDKAIVKILNDD